MSSKKELRKAMRLRRNAISASTARALSLQAQRNIMEDHIWKKADSVGLYSPIHQEVDTEFLKTSAWAEGKQTFFPYTESAGIMRLLPCADGDALVRSSFGILEPSPETCPVPPEGGWKPDLIIVPGIAYDREGYRVGSAGGYYDRFFAGPAMESIIRIGLCYGFQLVDHIDSDAWDIPMHAIATEEGVTWLLDAIATEEGAIWL